MPSQTPLTSIPNAAGALIGPKRSPALPGELLLMIFSYLRSNKPQKMLTNRARLMGVSRYCRQLVDQELAWWETIAINLWMGGQEMIEFYIKKAKNCDVKLFLWSNHSPSATVKRSFTGFWDMISTAGLRERVVSLSIRAHPREFMTFLPLPSPLPNLKKLRIRNSDLDSNLSSQWDSSTLHMLGSEHSLLQEHLPKLQRVWIEGLNPKVLGAGHSQFPHLTSLHYVGGEAERPRGASYRSLFILNSPSLIVNWEKLTVMTIDCQVDLLQSTPVQIIRLPSLVRLTSLTPLWSQVLDTPALKELICYDSRFQTEVTSISWEFLRYLAILVPMKKQNSWTWAQSQNDFAPGQLLQTIQHLVLDEPNEVTRFFTWLRLNPSGVPMMEKLELLGVEEVRGSILEDLEAVLQQPGRRNLVVLIPKAGIPVDRELHLKGIKSITMEEQIFEGRRVVWMLTSRS